MSCNKTKNCGCQDVGLHTPSPCEQGTPECPNPNPCSETFDSNCVMYNGTDSSCIEIKAGSTVQDVIELLIEKIDPFICLSCVSAVLPVSGSIDIGLTPTLTWNDVPTATSYDIYFDQNQPPTTLIVNTSNTSYTLQTPIAPLNPSTHYYWKVVPKNSGGSAIDCPTFELTTITDPCIHPIDNFFDQISFDSESTIETIERALGTTLDGGIVGSSCGACCPDCGVYVLGNMDIVYPLLNCLQDNECCIHFTGSVTNYITFQTNYANYTVQCCNDFNNCLEELKSAIPAYSNLLNYGVVEYSTINDNTVICVLVTKLQALGFSEIQIQSIMTVLLAHGLVIACEDGNLTITSIDTYMILKKCKQ